MYAVFETGGKQYKAQKGDIVFVEKLDAEVGKSVSFDALVVSDGDNVMIGTPIVKGAKVKAKVTGEGKEKKVIIFKYKSKDNYRKKQGHRQPFTKLEITGITTAKDKATEETAAEIAAEEKPVAKAAAKPAAAKKPAAKKPATAKATAAKTAAEKASAPAAEKKPAAKKTTAKATEPETK
jgi:large subunit ribosomal protein L21